MHISSDAWGFLPTGVKAFSLTMNREWRIHTVKSSLENGAWWAGYPPESIFTDHIMVCHYSGYSRARVSGAPQQCNDNISFLSQNQSLADFCNGSDYKSRYNIILLRVSPLLSLRLSGCKGVLTKRESWIMSLPVFCHMRSHVWRRIGGDTWWLLCGRFKVSRSDFIFCTTASMFDF